MYLNDIGELWLPISLIIFFVFLFGIIIGSFLNVCIIRLPRGESLFRRSSHCMTCGEKIKPYDMIPVFSWLILRGKCRNCGEKISSRYPLVEFLCGIMWVLAFLKFDISVQALLTALFFSALIVVGFMDWDTQTINSGVLMFIGLLAVLSFFLTDAASLKERLIGAAVFSIPFLIIGFITNGIGLGDTILMAAAGLFLGYKELIPGGLIGIFLACIVGLIIKFVTKNSKFAFGPWLSIGLALSVFVGDGIFSWYVTTFLPK